MGISMQLLAPTCCPLLQALSTTLDSTLTSLGSAHQEKGESGARHGARRKACLRAEQLPR